ncbi:MULTISPECIES: ActS/PrrB/RegB family redox-sensitive histidine kinase [unclassified Mesorhizobium]|uniref:ActS/PrrB/RegB family redox-sensitive histidine kinase n=1 Tax=unclassified Mesorhizobium TaxID=325217 RepID=UPI00112DED98|nr:MULTISPECIES: ActS/PrrB/RegB family redox-sensitive histidine kinase [unclassified Mesorhizobium]MBZ9920962.1 ActS/PrrB/RegB family redox-sensitive histidine kinase [Mesorhizobium sp. BR1-1-7]MBZ9970256.1 ActS/PrrB/RegB family redox-sensitive histidine kinase [Mesorhizobium sp. BR1-1-12]MBZ9982128.1 ActS/PrrB/RegB family redox-sensitive histidine kinase [Mesorhizobium sp. BR-1-1-8]TPK63498.1 ActS/PrrB/RegB family redox-sensitive histidine kinase [Mesorhizobium sp. B2-5-1]TPL35005.1 ActS/Prr
MAMINVLRSPDFQQSQRLRLNTLIRLRWLAIVGQSVTVLFVAYGLKFPLPVSLCFALIACSAWMNLILAFRFPAAHRLTPFAAFGILIFDSLQLAGLLYMTGGLTNPFSLLMTVPVVISATSLPLRLTAVLGGLVMTTATLLVFFHLPLPWHEGAPLAMPFIYVAGMWMAVLSSIAFTAIYAFRVAAEARLLANALAATELVLQREQHLSALDGLAAAAAHELGTPLATITLVAKEMEKALGKDAKYGEDVTLLRSQSERCREILKRLTSLSSEGEAHLSRLPLTSLVEEVTAPHRDFGISIKLRPGERSGPEPVGRRNPGVIYGLGNLVENAVDFARESVTVRWSWDEATVSFSIIDDGPGFPPEIIDRIGEPYMSTRQGTEAGGGLGLGLFIAKTLLERSGATLDFRNSSGLGEGAMVRISWPRNVFLNPESAPATMFDTA